MARKSKSLAELQRRCSKLQAEYELLGHTIPVLLRREHIQESYAEVAQEECGNTHPASLLACSLNEHGHGLANLANRLFEAQIEAINLCGWARGLRRHALAHRLSLLQEDLESLYDAVIADIRQTDRLSGAAILFPSAEPSLYEIGNAGSLRDSRDDDEALEAIQNDVELRLAILELLMNQVVGAEIVSEYLRSVATCQLTRIARLGIRFRGDDLRPN